jgi:hypothetical protein
VANGFPRTEVSVGTVSVVVAQGFPESDVSVGSIWVVVGKGQELKSVLDSLGCCGQGVPWN